MGDTVLDIPLGDVTKTWKEGLFLKKICFTAKTSEGEHTYKFGTMGTNSWLKSIEIAIKEDKNQ